MIVSKAIRAVPSDWVAIPCSSSLLTWMVPVVDPTTPGIHHWIKVVTPEIGDHGVDLYDKVDLTDFIKKV